METDTGTRDTERAARLMVLHWGERIALRRAELGLTQLGLAKRLGTNQQQVSKWEHGAQEPQLFNKYRLAEALQCTAADLFPMRP